jgi:hypothetical protein
MADSLNLAHDPGWLAGGVRCRACGHEWIAVRPFASAGEERLECPVCHEMTSEAYDEWLQLDEAQR